MQIVVLTTWFPTSRSPGAGSFIARDVDALSQDHTVRVIHLAPPELDDGIRERRVGAVPVRAIPVDVRTPRGLLSAARHLPHLLGDGEVLHTMAAPALLPFLLRRPSVPWVHTEHWSGVAGLGATLKSRVAMPLIRRAFDGPRRVVTVSDYLAQAVRRLRSGPVDVVGNIVDIDGFPAGAGESVFRGARVKVLGVGTVNPHKGWQLAVEAVRMLHRQGVDAELVWLGAGAQFEQLAAISDGVTVRAPGHLDPSRVRAAMSEADVLVLPTVSETFSLATLEALSCGLPVVATGVGAHTDFVTPGTGLVVPREAGEIADAIRIAVDLDRSAVRSRGRELASRFDESEFRRRYNTIYEEVTR